MKTFIVWRLINGKKESVVKLNSFLSKEEIKKKLIDITYDGIDIINPCLRGI